MLQEFLTLNIFAFLVVFARVGSAMMLFPGFSAPFVPVQTQLVVALAVSFVVTPVVAAGLPAPPASVAALTLLLVREIVIGLLFGSVARILVGCLQTAGTVIAYVSSLANAFILDPLVEQQSSLVAGFLGTMGLVVMFATDAHHLMLRAIVDSYSLFEPGAPLMLGDMTDLLTRRVADAFRLGVQMSAPLIVVGLTYYIGLALIARLMPALPVFFVGLPIQLAIQVFVFILSISGILMVFMTFFDEGMRAFMVP